MARIPRIVAVPHQDAIGPFPETMHAIGPETVAVVFGMDLINDIHSRFKKAVLKHVVVPPREALGDSDLLTHFFRLIELDALPYLSTTWKETRRFVSPEEMEQAGVTSCMRGHRPLTRNMLGLEASRADRSARRIDVVFADDGGKHRLLDLLEAAAEGQKFPRRASRIADAAEALGLVEADVDWKDYRGPTNKPIRATPALDAIMREVGIYTIAIIRSAAEAGDPPSETEAE